jgi:hypothetical protein
MNYRSIIRRAAGLAVSLAAVAGGSAQAATLVGTVLDLPAGATAVSPPMCVSAAYPSARAQVRDLVGPPSIHLFVQYTSTPSWLKPAAVGTFAGQSQWVNSQPLNLHPGNLYGWQQEVFTLTGGPKGTDAQVYNFYVDPHCFR